MYIRTDSAQDTDKLMSWVDAILTMRKIKKILNNKQSHTRQVYLIKQLLSPHIKKED